MNTLYIINLRDGSSYSDSESEVQKKFEEYGNILSNAPSMDFVMDLSHVRSMPSGIVGMIREFADDYFRIKKTPLPLIMEDYPQKNVQIYHVLNNLRMSRDINYVRYPSLDACLSDLRHK